ncbi:MAG: ATP-binding cassette domain-containing protein [Halieaceae bacterium]|nr:ATP-binding cassette domain-containing protein [Halieaceae bacterium]
MIIFEDIAIRRGAKLLLEGASATLQPGQRIALIGANGSGKSSLFAMLLGSLPPDQGEIRGMSAMRIAHMAQEAPTGDQSARDFVISGDRPVFDLLKNVAEAEANEDFDTAAKLHQQLDAVQGYEAPRRAEQLLTGLGFSPDQIERAVSQFSGGWRIRLNLARALMTPSDLLLLDEPTNHLDLDATLWLQGWLQTYPGTLLMISHDRDFIDATCERTLKIEGQRLTTYRGGYSDYERQRAEQLSQQQAIFEKQQRRVAEIEDFVRRFRYKATKAKQAQSRLKELERMQQVAPAHVDSPFHFQFPQPGKSSDPLLQLERASLGYGDTTILDKVDLTLRPGDRIGLLGKNGAGKSTLLKSLIGHLPMLSGERQTGAHLRIGYFDQQQLEVLDLDASPLLHLQRLTPERREQELLDFLGGFNFRGDAAKDPIAAFSGGEKARLALAMVVWQDPNLLVLDEPTNHLDLDMRHALEVALQGYEGALMLVSHDRHLLRNSVEQLVLVHHGRVEPFEDDLEAYEQWILSAEGKAAVEMATETESGLSRKERRQLAADARAKLRPLKKALEKVERDMEALQTRLTSIQQSLADPELYESHRKAELAELVRDEGEVKTKLAEIEEQWLQQQDELDALESRA